LLYPAVGSLNVMFSRLKPVSRERTSVPALFGMAPVRLCE
jgi:hypothetical protein